MSTMTYDELTVVLKERTSEGVCNFVDAAISGAQEAVKDWIEVNQLTTPYVPAVLSFWLEEEEGTDKLAVMFTSEESYPFQINGNINLTSHFGTSFYDVITAYSVGVTQK